MPIDNILASPLLLVGSAIAIVLFLIGITRSGKSKEMGKLFTWIGGAGLAVFLVLPLAGINILPTGPLAIVDEGEKQPQGFQSVCAPGQQVEDTTVTFAGVDKFTSVSVGGIHRYRVNGGPALVVADAGTDTLSPGDEVEILFGNESSSTYFGAVKTETIPCKGTHTISADMVQNGTLTMRIFNEEGNIIDGINENETVTSGDVVNLALELQGQFQRGFNLGGVIVVEYNKTVIDDVQIQLDGQTVTSTNVPSVYTITLGTDATTKAFLIPALTSNEKFTGTVVIDVDDSNNPADEGDTIISFYPLDYFINDDTGGSFDGPAVEDEDSVQTFQHRTQFTIHLD